MHKMTLRGFFLFALFVTFSSRAMADNLRLFNGREFVGILKEVNDESVTLDIGIGVVKFRRWEVQDIERWTESENEELQMKWAKKRIHDEAREETQPRAPNKR